MPEQLINGNCSRPLELFRQLFFGALKRGRLRGQELLNLQHIPALLSLNRPNKFAFLCTRHYFSQLHREELVNRGDGALASILASRRADRELLGNSSEAGSFCPQRRQSLLGLLLAWRNYLAYCHPQWFVVPGFVVLIELLQLLLGDDNIFGSQHHDLHLELQILTQLLQSYTTRCQSVLKCLWRRCAALYLLNTRRDILLRQHQACFLESILDNLAVNHLLYSLFTGRFL